MELIHRFKFSATASSESALDRPKFSTRSSNAPGMAWDQRESINQPQHFGRPEVSVPC